MYTVMYGWMLALVALEPLPDVVPEKLCAWLPAISIVSPVSEDCVLVLVVAATEVRPGKMPPPVLDVSKCVWPGSLRL